MRYQLETLRQGIRHTYLSSYLLSCQNQKPNRMSCQGIHSLLLHQFSMHLQRLEVPTPEKFKEVYKNNMLFNDSKCSTSRLPQKSTTLSCTCLRFGPTSAISPTYLYHQIQKTNQALRPVPKQCSC